MNDKRNPKELSMQLTKTLIPLIAVVALASGCATHSPMRMSNAASVSNKSTNTYASHTNKVFVTEDVPASSIRFEQLGQIDIGMTTYSSMDEVLKRLANKARELGADAVVDVHTWRQPSGWAWIAPQGNGQAVRFTDKASVDFSALKGEWR